MLQFLLLLFFVRPAGAQPLNSSTDLPALFILRSTLNVRSQDWPRKTDPCFTWSGVRCRSGRVVSINLSNLRRTRLGRLRPRFSVAALGDLGRLEIFNSTGFVLPGPIPTRFGFELPISIRILVLRSAEISGSIPSSLSRLVNLEVLDLSRNLIAGPVPLTIGALPNLKTLVLAHNKLSGSTPDSLWELGLQVLDVSFNNFSGILPYLVEGGLNGNVRSLVFNVSNNLYYGPVSNGFQMLLRRFEFVDLSGNYFQGTVPLEEDDRRKNQSFSLNCFKSASNQRNPVDCKHFYEAKGTSYDDTPSLIPARAKGKSQLWKYILAGVSGFIGVVIVVVLVVVLCFKRARAGTALNQGGIDIRAVSFRAAPPLPPSRVVSKNLTTNGEVFTYEQLVHVTSEFSSTNLIKNGHSGDLYHGVLESGFSVVVKKIDLDKAGHEGYVAELELFAKASHARLAPFLGQCLEGNERFLVYKRVPYGDLSSAMCKKTKQEEEELTSLDWITRLKIAAGVAEALCFLHHECNPPLVHRDVQASSILLDDKFEVRLGSLSEICAQVEDGHHNIFKKVMQRPQTSARQGTSGSPTATCDYDIYCFGKVLLELVTGKLGISGNMDPASMEGLDPTLGHIGACDKDSITKIIDPSLILDEDLTQEAWAVAVIAKSCMDPKPSNRPPARYVLKALENPLKIMRLYSRSNSVRLRTMSSRASWHGAFLGSWRKNSSDTGSGSDLLRRSGTVRSQGSVGDLSFTNRRRSVEIFPEPAGKDPADGDKVVGSV